MGRGRRAPTSSQPLRNVALGGLVSLLLLASSDAGSRPYHCTIHPSMTGTLNVTQQ